MKIMKDNNGRKWMKILMVMKIIMKRMKMKKYNVANDM